MNKRVDCKHNKIQSLIFLLPTKNLMELRRYQLVQQSSNTKTRNYKINPNYLFFSTIDDQCR